jgi:ketosteroid isomerase-like protein
MHDELGNAVARDNPCAMSEESRTPDVLELMRALSDAPAGEASLAFYAPDAIYDMSRLGMTAFEGRDAIGRFLEDWHRNYDEYDDEIEELVHVGGGVVYIAVRQNARPSGSPSHVRLRDLYGYVFEWRDGKVTRATVYADIDEARSAAEQMAVSRPDRPCRRR